MNFIIFMIISCSLAMPPLSQIVRTLNGIPKEENVMSTAFRESVDKKPLTKKNSFLKKIAEKVAAKRK